jgi:hypothetical protein
MLLGTSISEMAEPLPKVCPAAEDASYEGEGWREGPYDPASEEGEASNACDGRSLRKERRAGGVDMT